MKTEVIFEKDLDEYQLEKIKKYYKEGKIIAIPTETVYGLSADAKNFDAVSKIFLAKGRPSDNPLIVHFYSLNQLDDIVDYSEKWVEDLAKNFWPGPLTLILPSKIKSDISKNVSAGLDTLAVRMPSNRLARKILKYSGVLLAAPSANTSGKPSPTKYEHVENDLDGKVDAIIAGDDAEIGLESTVVDCTKKPFVIVRPGSILLRDIEKVLGQGNIVYHESFSQEEKVISPGMKYRHYSPEADLEILDLEFNEILERLIDTKEDTVFITYKNKEKYLSNLNCKIKYLAETVDNIEESNKNLYTLLRECDTENIKKIFIQKIEENEKNKALLNRLTKASSKK